MKLWHVRSVIVVGLVLLVLGYYIEQQRQASFHEGFECGCKGPCRCRFPIQSMYSSPMDDPPRGEPPGRSERPYFVRQWPVCAPGSPTCLSQTYQEPEGFHNLPRDTLSCQPSCRSQPANCEQNPFLTTYENPRWRNERFFSPKEMLPGLSTEWYPTAPMTS